MVALAVWMLALGGSPAWAGSGPWVLGPGEKSLYVGVEGQRLEELGIELGDGERDVIEVDEGISTFGVKAIASTALLSRFEIEAGIPWYRAQLNRQGGAVCTALGGDTCATTQGLGVIHVRGKALLVDEVFGPPLSLAVGAETRFGTFTHAERNRVTNLGEGTFDLGAFLAVGRTGGLGAGYWSAFLETQWTQRFPNTRNYPGETGDVAAPGGEWTGQSEWLLAFDPRIAFGPAATFLWRPNGLDWYELDLADPDRFAALRVANVRVGGKVIIRDQKRTALSLGGLYTVFARNNPVDVFIVNAGVSVNGFLDFRAED